ncbi:hypothetical protein [Thiohalocapsa halophila]|uniref:hypothetical protein n=1 Tax=Thiohalocapsa halophila TaxID=69359 RepID=UPI001903F3F7|nr:hypothetical protein [Thiohalocapsa halophila]
MSASVLYYPHIEIADPKWLKTALLLWDNVYRIVPTTYAPADDDDTKRAVDAGHVRPVTLEKPDLQGIADDFRGFLQALPDLPAGLEPGGEVSQLHPEKVDATLYPLLDQYAQGGSKGGWIELPSEIVRGYMFYLSAKVAERRQLHRCTDSKYSYAISTYFTEEANFDEYLYNRESPGFYASLILQDVLPINVEGVPMDHILRVAQSSRDERLIFRNELQRFTDGLRDCRSKDHAETVLNDYKQDLLRAKDNLKRAQGFLGEHDRGSLLTMGAPVALTAFGGLVAAGVDPFDLLTLSSSLLLGAMAAYTDFSRATAASANPYGASYLVSLEREFAGTGNFPAFDRYLEEFVND